MHKQYTFLQKKRFQREQMKVYNPFMVTCDVRESRKARWDMANNPVSGREYIYAVKDHNFRHLNDWEFTIRVPYARCKDKNIQIQPRLVPDKVIWKGMEFRVITFIPTTTGNHPDKYYCKMFLSDVSGSKTKEGTRRGERDILPPWLQLHYYRSIMRLKKTVASTHGSDHYSQVMIVKPDDFLRMIRIFFANKIWVVQEGYKK